MLTLLELSVRLTRTFHWMVVYLPHYFVVVSTQSIEILYPRACL